MKLIYRYLFVIIFFLIKYNTFSQPAIQWSYCYGGTNSEGAYSIIMTLDSCFIVVGITNSSDGDVSGLHQYYDTINQVWSTWSDIWVIKIDQNGSLLWQKCLGSLAPDIGTSLVEVTGGYVLACTGGTSGGDISFTNGLTDFWIVKIDYAGNLIWEHSFGGSLQDIVYGITTCPDGGVLITGSENSVNDGDVTGHHGVSGSDSWIIKVDSSGNLLWQRCLGGTSSELYEDVKTDSFGYIYIISSTGSIDGDVTCNLNGHNAWLVKMDPNGSIIWDKCFGGTAGQIISSIEIKGSRLLISGKTVSSDGDLTHNYGQYDAWILLIDTSGNKIFSQSYGGSATDIMYDATFLDDNRIIACGSTLSNDHDVTMNHPSSSEDCWVICVDTIGNLIWQNTYGGSLTEIGYSLTKSVNNEILVAGVTNTGNDGDIINNHGPLPQSDWWIFKLDAISQIQKNELQISFKTYPQPFSESFNIQLPFIPINNSKISSVTLFDLEGRQVNAIVTYNENEIRVTPKDNIAPGFYFVEFITEGNVYDFKILKM